MDTEIKNEVVEGNKLIAEFLGAKYDGRKYWTFPDGSMKIHSPDYSSQLKYHSSWDWLMPVVEKIGKMYDPYKYKAYELKEAAWEIVDLSIVNPIDEVYDSVIKFIHGTNKPNSK